MRRKVTGIILCITMLIASLVFAPTSLAADETPYQIVRVKLSIGKPAAVPFHIDGNYSVAQDESITLARQDYTVSLNSGVLSLKYGETVLYSGTEIRLVQHAPTDGLNNFIQLNNAVYGYCNYLGDLVFSIYNGYIRVINHVYIEDYLYSVVPYEMSNSWPMEALKAQAVSARSYASTYSGKIIDDTSGYQVYKSYNPTYARAKQAVDETSKTVLVCDGDIIRTYFSASNGGITEITQHVWNASLPLKPYQVIKEDPYDIANPASSQELLIFPKTVTDSSPITYQYSSSGAMVTGSGSEAATAARYLRASCLPAVTEKGYIAGVTDDVQIVSIEGFVLHTLGEKHHIPDYNGNNLCIMYENADVTMTVLAYRYSDGGGSAVTLGDCNDDGEIDLNDYMRIRLYILGLTTLDAHSILAADVNSDGVIELEDYMLIRMHILGLKDLSQQSIPGDLVQEPVTVTFTIGLNEFHNSKGLYCAFSRNLRLFVVEETDTAFNLYHRRYGHGIGLSQRGAQQRANKGQTYQDILSFYYPNTTYGVLDISAPVLTAIDSAPS